MARPLGDISRALLAAAAAAPGTVRELCERAQVGFDVGRKTASRMLSRGDLQVLEVMPPSGPGRPPAVVGMAAASAPDAALSDLAAALSGWHA